jgi:tRNA(Ile)-lysidine synthase
LPGAVAVAASGGRDSTALLHATARAARALGLQVHALHVHHGLVAEADDWLAQLRSQCRRWARSGLPVQFHARRLTDSPAAGDSVEAWARRRRYGALAEMAADSGCSLVLLAHHRRDQAETLLLQALRGGGPAGLAAMPRHAVRAGLTWARPWLEQPREAIEAYLRRFRLRYVDDASNVDMRFARNRLRSAVWPALADAFADAEPQLHAAALRASEAAACLDELAAADAAAAVADGVLLLDRWQLLTPPRRSLLLRTWLRGLLVAPVPETLVRRLAAELAPRRSGRWPAPGGEIRLHDGRLGFAATAAVTEGERTPGTADLSRPGRHEMPGWGGTFVVEAVASHGTAVDNLRRATLRERSGGEHLQMTPYGLPRSLKKQYQARRVPAWERSGPLVYCADRLLFAPGLGLDARCLAAPGSPQLSVAWVPQPPDRGRAAG